MKLKIAILTKSSRHGQYCVVGYDINNCKLVRLVSNDINSQGSITEKHLICDNNQIADILDIVEVDIISGKPTETHPEDLLINELLKWKYIGKFELDYLPTHMLCTDEFIYNDISNEINLDTVKQIKKSIIIAKVEKLNIYKNEYRKIKDSFEYNDFRYINFSVTDPDYYEITDVIKYNSAILIISLPNDKWSYENDRFFKFIAKIYPIG